MAASLVGTKLEIPSYQMLQQKRRERHRLERLKQLEVVADVEENVRAPSPPAIVLPDEDSIAVALTLVTCDICKRNFNEDRIKVHQKICKNIDSHRNDRKPYSGVEHRRSPQLEVYLKAKRGEIVSPSYDEEEWASKRKTPRLTAVTTKNQETWMEENDLPLTAGDDDITKNKPDTPSASKKFSQRSQISEKENSVAETKKDFVSANINQMKQKESPGMSQKKETTILAENVKTPKQTIPIHSVLLRAKSAINSSQRETKPAADNALQQNGRLPASSKVNVKFLEKTRSNLSVQRKLPPLNLKNSRTPLTRPKSTQDSGDGPRVSQMRKQGLASSVAAKDSNKSPLKVQQNNQQSVIDTKRAALSKHVNVQLSITPARDNKTLRKAQPNEQQGIKKGDKLLVLKPPSGHATVTNSRSKAPLPPPRQQSEQKSRIPRSQKPILPRYQSDHTSIASTAAKATRLPTLTRRQSDQATPADKSKIRAPLIRNRNDPVPSNSKITKPSQNAEQISGISRCNKALPAKDQARKSFVSTRRNPLPKRKDDEFTIALRAATKYEEFIQAIRAAKQVRAQFKQATTLPSSPLEKPKHILCPHCKIDFIEAAAKHHIGKCAYMVENPQKPPALPKKVAWR